MAHDDFLRSNVGVATAFLRGALWASFIYFRMCAYYCTWLFYRLFAQKITD